jgi:hypothetical protein
MQTTKSNDAIIANLTSLKLGELRGMARQAARDGKHCDPTFRAIAKAYTLPVDAAGHFASAFDDELTSMSDD